jgi:hypothetical protein
MHRRNLRHLLLAGATRLILSAADGDDEPAGGGRRSSGRCAGWGG